MTMRRGIFIVEDHEIFRMGLKELIDREEDLVVCGEADNASDALRLIREARPAMAVIDISLKDSNGIMLIKDVNKCMKGLPMLVLSLFDEAIYAERALAAGARGYIMKHETSDSIVRAIRQILDGGTYVSAAIMDSLVQRLADRTAAFASGPIETLTDRELEIFTLIGKGLPTGAIARKLALNVKTVGTYRERIKEKLDIKTAADLAKRAALWVSDTSGDRRA